MNKTIFSLISILWAGAVSATTHYVTNAVDFNALPTLNAGDHVIMLDGTYGALDTTLSSSISDDSTAMANPVLIYAENPGGVVVTAPSEIYMEGRGITLAGIDFAPGSGMKDNGSTSPAYIIRMGINSRYMTLNNIRFKDCVSGDSYGNWVIMNGFNNVIEYCTFEGKDEPIANATIAVSRSTSEAGIGTPRNHVIRKNYFGPREASTSDNGYETIRIGSSSSQAHSMAVTVEENVFYRSIWRTDGQKGNEPEIISNKSADNIIRNNTFLESQGQITLRHGDRALVEGNFVFGGGYYSGTNIVVGSANAYQGGVRLIGIDHIIRNNYFENLQGDDARAALVVVQGVSGFDDGDGTYGDNTYEAAHNAQIYHNTFVGCEQMNLGFAASDTSVMPTNVIMYNNAWQGVGSSAAVVRESGFNIGASSDNYIYEPNGNYGWTGLSNGTYTDSVTPDISEGFNNYRIPISGSPLLDDALFGVVPNDIRGLSRPGSNDDIGSFEREVPGIGKGPLLRNEVGPGFDGGPSGTYPVFTGLDPNLPPSGNFDLTQYYLTMPVDSMNGFSGEATNISTAVLSAGYENEPWFYTGSAGEMIFSVPWNGAVRGSSSSPRSELRETYADGTLRNWTPLDDGGVHILNAVCTVDSVGDGKVSIGQIHGKVPDAPTVIIRYNNTVDPARMDVSVYDTADGLGTKTWLYYDAPALGEEIAYQMKMTGTDTNVDFSCTINGVTQTVALTDGLEVWKAATFYFKAGAYYTVPDTGNTAQVSFSALELVRGELAITTSLLPNGVLGQPYSQTLQTAGGASGLEWSIESGALPTGLTLSTNGVISGVALTNGVSRFTVRVVEGASGDVQSLSLAIDQPGANPEYFSEDYESGQVVGDQPVGASVMRPTSNTGDNFVKVVDDAGNNAGSGNGVQYRDDGSVSTLLSYNFVSGSGAQVSAVRVDFDFSALSTNGSSSHYTAIGLGEFDVSQSLNANANRFTDARLYADGTIDFRSNAAGGSNRNGNPILNGSNSLTIIANDYDATAVDYIGHDDAVYSLPANSVAYWFNGSLVLMNDGNEYLDMDLQDVTAGGFISNTINNLGKFGFYSSTSYTGLDFIFDNIRVSSLSAGSSTNLAIRNVYGVAASADDGNVPENTLDGSLSTRWSAFGVGQWIQYDLGIPQNIHEVKIAFHQGAVRTSEFKVEVSVDGSAWSTVLPLTTSSGTTTNLENFSFTPVSGQYVRIIGFGNSSNDWNSFSEVEIHGVASELSAAPMVEALSISGNQAVVSVLSDYGAAYQLERTDSLTSNIWTVIGMPMPGDGDTLDLHDDNADESVLFYRLNVQP